MKAGLVLLMIISAMLMFATMVYAHEGTINNAAAVMKDAKGNTVGLATFTEDANGLSESKSTRSARRRACTGQSFTSAGEHYNPLGKEHGLDNPKGPHTGDLPNFKVGEDGTGHMNVTTDCVTLSPGPTMLFTANGTSLVIHAGPDDQMTNPAGNSDARIICGVIEKK